MAKKKAKSNTKTSFFANANRKKEILGIVIMAIGALFGTSILTYNPNDFGFIHRISFYNLFMPNTGPALLIKNGLGVVGAYAAHFFVYVLFGYFSIFLPIILIVYGWYVFRSKPLEQLNWQVFYIVCMIVLVSMITGWFANEYHWQTIVWNGVAGLAMARILIKITGLIGSIILLSALFIIGFSGFG